MSLKENLKKILPNSLIGVYRSLTLSRKKHFKSNMTVKEIFTDIYHNNSWLGKESVSGTGSDLNNVSQIINELPRIFSRFEVKTILDVPCGDFNWMKNVNLKDFKYIGGDIVSEIVESNKVKYQNDNITFDELNIIESNLPKVDLVFVRDCFIHLSNADIQKAILNIKASNSKYLMVSTYTDKNHNVDIVTGEWRPVNLQISPFNFPPPIFLLNENCQEGNGAFADKSLGIWKLDDLPGK